MSCVITGMCSRVYDIDDFPACTFAVIDVGQGLSQICVVQGTSFIFDVGDSSAGDSLQKNYERLGSPPVGAIIISHTHIDHLGGLSKLTPSMSFSGQIITHPNEDTAYIRWRVAADWRDIGHFTMISQGDTVPGLPGVRVECVWPPKEIDTTLYIDTRKNRYSMCFLLRCGVTTALVTSDIDTAAERELSRTYGFGLKSDVMVIPHHGSAASADPIFYGFVNPSAAVNSCGTDNAYGFPSQRMIDLVYQMRIELHRTDQEGSAIAYSDGYYWEWR